MIRGLEPQRRRAARQGQSRPIVDDLRAWPDTTLTKMPHRSRTARAIRYALKLSADDRHADAPPLVASACDP